MTVMQSRENWRVLCEPDTIRYALKVPIRSVATTEHKHLPLKRPHGVPR